VLGRRYLGEVETFYRTLWLIHPRHCISVSIKNDQALRQKNWCVLLRFHSAYTHVGW